jgi:hypothetical protein
LGVCWLLRRRASASSMRALSSQLRNSPSCSKRGARREAVCQQFSTALFACSGPPRTRHAMNRSIRYERQNLTSNTAESS